MNICSKSQTLSNIWNTSSKWINFPSQSYSWSWSVFGKQNACIHWLALPGKHIFFAETNPSMWSRKELWEKKQQQPHIHRITHYHNLLPTQQNIARAPMFLRFLHCLTQQKPTYLKVATPGHKGIVTREGCHKETQDLFHNTWIEDLQSRGGGSCLRNI